MANPMYGQNKADGLIDSIKSNHVILEKTVVKTSKAITATAAANSDGTVAQPAGTTLRSVIISPQSVITSDSGGSDDLDFSMGTAAGGAQILAAKALIDGASVSLTAGAAYEVISGGLGQGANAFVGLGTATSEASPVVGDLYSAGARDVHFRFTPLNNDLVATGTVDVICTFVKTSATNA
tara:strand:- start:401 stop:943 length:543 start_codon:yes stop_codon:yes gene_type:complete